MSSSADTTMSDAAAPSPASNSSAAPISLTSSTLPPNRTLLYSLLIRQLHDDGFTAIGAQLTAQTNVPLNTSFPPAQLARLVDAALASLTVQEGAARARMKLGKTENSIEMDEANQQAADGDEAGEEEEKKSFSTSSDALLDLHNFNTRISTLSTPFPSYSSRYGFNHADAVTCAAFSSDGALVATGSRDSSIKLLDVSLMRAAPVLEGSGASSAASATSGVKFTKMSTAGGINPVLRNYCDHEAPISDLAFHPFEPFVLSGSRDQTLKLFNFATVRAEESTGALALQKKASKVLALENSPVTSVAFHPSGDFILVGTEQPHVRLYDARTFSSYVSSDFMNFHSGAITSCRFHPIRGSTYATSSIDGSIKVWDGVSNALVRTLANAHSGSEVSSVEYSPSGNYLLSNGKDNTSKLWDIDSGRCLMTYHGAVHQQSHVKAQFEHSGEFVMCGDEATAGLAIFDTRTSEMVRRLDFHARTIRSVGVSPTEAAFITCGDDNKCRFWSV